MLALGQMASNSLSGNLEQTGSVLLFDNNMTKLVKKVSGFIVIISQYDRGVLVAILKLEGLG